MGLQPAVCAAAISAVVWPAAGISTTVTAAGLRWATVGLWAAAAVQSAVHELSAAADALAAAAIPAAATATTTTANTAIGQLATAGRQCSRQGQWKVWRGTHGLR